MIFNLLSAVENFEILRKEVLDIIETKSNGNNQIICQGTVKGISNWTAGTGAIEELDEKDEKKYSYINSELKNTELEKLIKKYNGFRSRIMIMHPRHCYSVHSDPTPRLHIPIVTNDQCWMIWPNKKECYQLHERMIYWTDTRVNHTFLNGGTEKRIHVVMCVEDSIIQKKVL